jgi:hypothetical protein
VDGDGFVRRQADLGGPRSAHDILGLAAVRTGDDAHAPREETDRNEDPRPAVAAGRRRAGAGRDGRRGSDSATDDSAADTTGTDGTACNDGPARDDAETRDTAADGTDATLADERAGAGVRQGALGR